MSARGSFRYCKQPRISALTEVFMMLHSYLEIFLSKRKQTVKIDSFIKEKLGILFKLNSLKEGLYSARMICLCIMRLGMIVRHDENEMLGGIVNALAL